MLLLTRFRPSAKLRNAAKPGAQRDPLRALRRGRKKYTEGEGRAKWWISLKWEQWPCVLPFMSGKLTAGWLEWLDPDWKRCISYIEYGDIPAIAMLVYQRVRHVEIFRVYCNSLGLKFSSRAVWNSPQRVVGNDGSEGPGISIFLAQNMQLTSPHWQFESWLMNFLSFLSWSEWLEAETWHGRRKKEPFLQGSLNYSFGGIKQ